MPGGLVSLVAVGVQDQKLTQDPEITFFKAVYRPYINFALESIEQTFAGTAGFNKRVQSEMSRNGDLVKDAVLEITLPTVTVSQTGLSAGTAETETITIAATTANQTSGDLAVFQDGSLVFALDAGTVAATAKATIEAAPIFVAAGGVTATVSANIGIAAGCVITIVWTSAGNQTQVIAISSLLDEVNGEIGEPTVATTVAGVAAADARTAAWVKNVGHVCLNNFSVEIGGQTIDKHYGQWYDIWTELTIPEEKREGYNTMIGQQNITEVLGATTAGAQAVTYQYDGLQTQNTAHASTKLYVPLKFWFNINPGLALPIIALQYHQIKLLFEFRPSSELLIFGGGATSSNLTSFGDLTVSLWLDYVFLDNAERRNYAQTPHEYLINQLQFTGSETVDGASAKILLNFNHPVEELVWVFLEADAETGNLWSNFETVNAAGGAGAANLSPLTNAKLQLNGQDRFAQRDGEYFRLVQPYNHHSRVPTSKGIFVYSFALSPEDYQPNGTTNFSRIDTATLVATLSNVGTGGVTAKSFVYARNYNLFRIASGMGGLAYAS